MTSIDLRSLQDDLATVDMLSKKPNDSRSDLLEILLKKHEQIKLKMYQEPSHAFPHFHVDYGSQNHAASFAVSTGERIEGNLPNKYDKAIANWTAANRVALLATWDDLKSGGTGEVYVQSLGVLRN